ncbi:BTAD domain-containing putative transcriptional regulator [Nocardiopsis flavescens]|uniref:AfsR/SARP family transcriptional regulator n=1 Tax=Nocardiopsis flavescens TaxID=758803 RepID=UPI003647D47E
MGGSRQRAFFSALVLQANRSVSQEEIIHAVWGNQPPDSVTSSVHTYVSRLRRVLEPDRRPRSASALLEFDGLGYRLNIDTDQVDVHRVEAHVETGKRHIPQAPRTALTEFERALALWRGRPLVGIPGPLAEIERSRLEELHFTILEMRFDLMLSLGMHNEAVHELSSLTQRHPLRERLRGLLIHAYSLCGRRAEALAEFQNLRRELVQQLGIEPNEEVQHQHMRILRGEPVLARGGHHDPSAGLTSPLLLAAPPAQLPRAHPDLVGRDHEVQLLRTMASEDLVSAKYAPLLYIDGAAGTGKSALAVRLAHEMAAHFPDGQLYVDLRGDTTSKGPLGTEQALQHMLFSLGQMASNALPAESLIGLYRSLTAGKKMLVVLDNAFSHEQVRPLLPGAPGCAVIVTGRDTMTGLVTMEGARRLTLGPLRSEDAVLLVKRSVGRALRQQHNALGESALPSRWVLSELCRIHGYTPLALHDLSKHLIRFATTEGRCAADAESARAAAEAVTATGTRNAPWPYGRLGRETARVLRALGMFSVPSLPRDAVAAMLGPEIPLVDRHLDLLVVLGLVGEEGGRLCVVPRLRAYTREEGLREDPPGTRFLWARRMAYHCTAAVLRSLHASGRCPDGRGPAVLHARTGAAVLTAAERAALCAVVAEAARVARDR